MSQVHQDWAAAFGVPGMMPEVLNPPAGWTLVKVRMRPDEFISAYFRKDRSFARWWMKWADAKHLYLEPIYPVAVNLRPARET